MQSGTSRRNFMRRAVGAAGLAALTHRAAWAQGGGAKPCLHFFTKPLQWLDFDPLAEALAAAGYGGLDLAVRPKGHVEPERVEQDLPRAVAAARQHGLRVDMIVTAITSAQEPLAERVLKCAAQCGVKVYRLGYYKYDFKQGVEASIESAKRELSALAELNQRCGITGCYQNHYAWRGDLIGGPVWDVHALLKGLDPQWLGCQYDVRHAVAEAHGSWSVGMRLLAPWIRSVCLKDFVWSVRNGRTVPGSVLSGEGIVPWPTYFGLCREFALAVPASVHCEWELLSKEEEQLPVAQRSKLAVERLAHDARFFSDNYSKYGVKT